MGLTLLPLAASAQIYQDVSNSTATVVRDPARQASTETDAVLFNPAGTAFLDDGWHFSLNSKVSYQKFDLSDNYTHIGESTKDRMPSLQAAYKKGPWALSFAIGNEGGYGSWDSSEDPTLSRLLTNINNQIFDVYKNIMNPFSSNCNNYDQLVSKVLVGGSLYNYSTRIGAAYQINSHLSVYGGLRFNYATERSIVTINRWVARSDGGISTVKDYFSAVDADFQTSMQNVRDGYQTLADLCNLLGIDASHYEEIVDLSDLAATMGGELNNQIAGTPNATTLIDERNSGWGLSPVIGIDYKVGKFNFAAKYEFETKIHTNGDALSYHIPSTLSLGASWQIQDNLKLSLGGTLYHQNFDKLYGRKQMTDLSDDNIFFNMNGIAQVINSNVSIYAIGNDCTDGDISASISFSPINRLLFSFGYTYASQSMIGKGIYSQSITMSPVNSDIISGGLRYDINDKVQLDFGISKKTSRSTQQSNLAYYLSQIEGTTMSAGININL